MIVVSQSNIIEQLHHENSSYVERVLSVVEIQSSQMDEDQDCKAFNYHDMPHVLSWRKYHQEVYHLLLDPKYPLVIWKEETLEPNGQRH